ncbi:D-alanyl-D-alanine carboxypeptidase/D-alanyl-D-alanine endopeptidase [Actinomadura keratinilytica]|jgi:D-alanyl-D-alanine carboxypeptidase/D-alanyl-D-alanine-endopeptidase (penicillin-binding protein 4)|uniref:D-alanyl-D-alanine carboxypeptidase/D-alanyl-D-alanine-endopeptidase n=1 Tax=Actinomadura keratinilytica TaxID=547461 RepID=A0ABP7YEK2_9ACTN
MRRRIAGALGVLLALGLTATPAAAHAEPVRAAPAPAGDLRSDLDAILSDPRLADAGVGVLVSDARTGAVRYARGADAPLLPASNNKLNTAAAALALLGPGYRFRTSVLAAKADGSTVTGNLYLKGTGDPTMRAAEYDALAARLAARGITRVTGDLVADDTWFDAVRTPAHWDPADLQYAYAGPISALTVSPNDDFDAGSVKVAVAPTAPGSPVGVTLDPPTSAVKLDNRAVTGPAGSASTLSVERANGSDTIVVRGSYPAGGARYETLRTVPEPTLYAADVFRAALADHGITVEGTVRRGAAPARAVRLADRASMPLSQLTTPFLKFSNNVIAEILVKSIGRKAKGKGTWEAGLPVIERYVRSLGVPAGQLEMADGSGLSRLNRTSPRDIATVLRRAQTQTWFPAWYQALPVAGDPDPLVGGTLTGRMRGTPAAGNVRAKTGTLTGVTALSGYVREPSGRRLVFSVIFNGYAGGAPKDIEDKIAVRLAGGSARAVMLQADHGSDIRLECTWTASC